VTPTFNFNFIAMMAGRTSALTHELITMIAYDTLALILGFLAMMTDGKVGRFNCRNKRD